MKRNKSDELDAGIVNSIKTAIRVGYRHIDTAEMYNTELEVGAAIKESIAEGIVKREELFVTTKISDNFLEARTSIDVSLGKLGLDYVDSYALLTHSSMANFSRITLLTPQLQVLDSLSILDDFRSRPPSCLGRDGSRPRV